MTPSDSYDHAKVLAHNTTSQPTAEVRLDAATLRWCANLVDDTRRRDGWYATTTSGAMRRMADEADARPPEFSAWIRVFDALEDVRWSTARARPNCDRPNIIIASLVGAQVWIEWGPDVAIMANIYAPGGRTMKAVTPAELRSALEALAKEEP